uniref:Uncharacterized protein n=1 Tax=Cajanus cajan TaxID=3821 RepID=A0A151QLT8_CAJCA|nr:hypothetical protein KK1_048549 [Cajanus cajan]
MSKPCSLNSSFLITCNKSLSAPIPYLKDSFGQNLISKRGEMVRFSFRVHGS